MNIRNSVKSVTAQNNTFKMVGISAVAIMSAFVLLGSGENSGSSSSAGSNSSENTSVTSSSDTSPSSSDIGESSEVDDVTITSCGADDLGQLEAVLRITNNSSKPSNYMINVAFESPDGSEQLDTGFATVSTLQPGQSTNESAITFTTAPADFKCRITSVDRYAS